MAAVATLERTTFRTSRLLEFCSRKELVAQTGHEPDAWPLVVLKELVDNALDACEEAGIAPDIEVQVEPRAITVVDNGPGIPPKTVTDILDFYGAILFVEKEGFLPLFRAVRLAERYDLAIMSTKGLSVTASRLLVDRLCAAHQVSLLVLHDFDKSGFSILGTLRRDTRRYAFRNRIEVVDLGLRLEDVEDSRLEAEDVVHRSDPAPNLRENGATAEEISFLRSRRVELNAFTSADFVAWIERKLEQHGWSRSCPTRTL
jgi:DNA topoisomerase VI subunit A